ncbi:hypothetical protein CPT03_21940 [Pedobacter ginsengisoli]|uniref:Histidine kinase n=1 Tax=Pedobacter ginsengisoli TaxID=363852 RepID=A0A2D1UBI0_9SPHI|nr:hypothetical protein [Pedobacter ginsengisoli]ATP58939.1 hypothetical protein CPT03_21940 [Pedobacter ginsengisoli]
MLQHYKYPLKIWLTSILISPMLYLLIIHIGGYKDNYSLVTPLAFYALAVIIASTYSIPNFILLWVAYYFISSRTWPTAFKKVVLLLVSVLLTIILFSWNFKHLESISREDYITAISYMITVAFGCLVYKV